MKFNRSSIMKRAWQLFRCWKDAAKRFPNEPLTTFSGCLKQAWDEAKRAIIKARGVVRMHYGEYKRNYADCRTVSDSYDRATKTIEVFVNEKKKDCHHLFYSRANRRGCIR